MSVRLNINMPADEREALREIHRLTFARHRVRFYEWVRIPLRAWVEQQRAELAAMETTREEQIS